MIPVSIFVSRLDITDLVNTYSIKLGNGLIEVQAQRVVDPDQDAEGKHDQNVVEVGHERAHGACEVSERFDVVGAITIGFRSFDLELGAARRDGRLVSDH